MTQCCSLCAFLRAADDSGLVSSATDGTVYQWSLATRTRVHEFFSPLLPASSASTPTPSSASNDPSQPPEQDMQKVMYTCVATVPPTFAPAQGTASASASNSSAAVGVVIGGLCAAPLTGQPQCVLEYHFPPLPPATVRALSERKAGSASTSDTRTHLLGAHSHTFPPVSPVTYLSPAALLSASTPRAQTVAASASAASPPSANTTTSTTARAIPSTRLQRVVGPTSTFTGSGTFGCNERWWRSPHSALNPAVKQSLQSPRASLSATITSPTAMAAAAALASPLANSRGGGAHGRRASITSIALKPALRAPSGSAGASTVGEDRSRSAQVVMSVHARMRVATIW